MEIMITGKQVRCARHALGITVIQLSRATGVSHAALHRIEKTKGVPNARASTLHKIEKYFESEGLEFLIFEDRAGISWPQEGPNEDRRY